MTSLETIRAEILKRQREELDTLENHGATYAPVVEALARFEPRFSVGGGSLDIAFSGDKHALEATWGVLRKAGFNCSNARPKPNQPTYGSFFNHPTGAVIWLSFSSTVCRRVKIGTQMVEQDIYETVCGEQTFETPELAEDLI